MKRSKDTNNTSRRDFFKIAGAVGLAAGTLGEWIESFAKSGMPVAKANGKGFTGGKIPQGATMAKGRVLGANDRVNVAFIGVGNMGTKHVENFKAEEKKRNTASIAVSDLYTPRLDRAVAKILEGNPEGQTVQADKDYR